VSLLEMEGVSSGYGETPVLRELACAIDAGTVVALLGRNGMGKSTTVSTIAGVLPLSEGTIRFDGRDVSRHNSIKRARAGIGLVPEKRQVFRSCTVAEHLTMGARHPRSRDSPWTVDRLYATFPVLERRSRAKGNELSGGEQQMLAIARALSANPELLLLDEPSEGLAPSVVQEIAEVIRQLAVEHAEGAILLVEQNMPLALSIADRVMVMSHGEIVFTGTAEEFSARADIQARYIGVG
jgi:branched-chain amino acid transport system ATP-binding protein